MDEDRVPGEPLGTPELQHEVQGQWQQGGVHELFVGYNKEL